MREGKVKGGREGCEGGREERGREGKKYFILNSIIGN
jgi:hypothetical protein